MSDWFGEWEVGLDKIKKIIAEDILYNIEESKFKKIDNTRLSDKVLEYYKNNYNNKVYREWLWDVALSKRWVKSSITHWISPQKAAAFEAVPEIIKNWEQVNFIQDRRTNWVDDYVFASPIIIEWKKYICVVSVEKSTRDRWSMPRYYLHEVKISDDIDGLLKSVNK